MADSERFQGAQGSEEEQRLMEGMAVLDFDMLCSTVALQAAQGKWKSLDGGIEGEEAAVLGDFGVGVLRMWEGEVLDCFEDRRIALQSAWGGCMAPIGIRGGFHLFLLLCAFVNGVAFAVTRRHYFLYLAAAFTISIVIYLGFFRAQIRKKFNIKGSDNSGDDCLYHLLCPCCTLCQESRTLEMNNVQDGIWHGRGDTICIGTYGDGDKAFVEVNLPPILPTKSPDPCSMQKITAES
ncbi:hypothetical protein CDL15_Pgr000271 [Punica granatum]|uniref:Uncharacterized protein n=1 Tax=Punica granatum TaxID=22663 RepID=A0A218Y1Z9_PUNGR|nr:hypothetical protein CDL15_Pgr000271 [Punica granatum]